MKQYLQAMNAFQQALLINPEFALAWYNMGEIYYFTGERPKVMEIYTKLLVLDADIASLYYNDFITQVR